MDQINSNSSGLSDAQEILLMSYSEGQLGWWGGLRARTLMRNNKAALEFVESLKVVTREALVWEESRCAKIGSGDNLIDNVFKRIEQEERSEVFLGKRQEEVTPSFSEMLSGMHWGRTLAAVSVAAAVVLVAVQVFQSPVRPGSSATLAAQVGGNDIKNIETVSLEKNENLAESSQVKKGYVEPKIIDRGYATAMEVDWMRSNTGHVRVLHDEPGSAPIIWVRKRR